MSVIPFRRMIFPGILLIVAVILYYAVPELPLGLKQVIDWLPYAALGMALALSGYNGQSRLFTLTAALIIIYYLVMTRLQVSLERDEALVIYSLLTTAIPLMMLYLLLIPERGLWNRYGLAAFAVVPVLLIAGTAVFHYVPEATLLQIVATHLPVKPFSGYVMSVQASIGFGIILALALFKLSRSDSEYDAAFTVVLLLLFLMLALFDRPGISDLMLSLAGISLVVSMMRAGYELAYRDELTGLLGRRALNERLENLGKRYVIAMLDVDHFKKFNDTYGHDSGDDVLKMVAKHVGDVSGGGTAYRYGGEEFSIVFPGRKIEFCRPFLEALRATIEAYEMQLRDIKNRPESKEVAKERRGRRAKSRNKAVSVTISIGVAEANDKTATPEEVIKAADAALYQAKKKGRNRVVVSQ